MGRTVAIGIQDFEKLIRNNYFYIDKTHFIKEWWESGVDVTLITRPRRFGKTLNMSMVEKFFSFAYADWGKLFEDLSIWKEEKYRELQGAWPVISLSFADVKTSDYESTKKQIRHLLVDLYVKHAYLRDSDVLTDADKLYYGKIMSREFSDSDAAVALKSLSDYLCRYYGRKVILLLDEYDTPMQEAFVGGFWGELAGFMRSLFNSTFKTNPHLERGLMTGITRISRESIFSDLNNLKVVTTTSEKYATSFGFTEEEVFAALDEYGMADRKEEVKRWYDGFIFGKHKGIYNPWSVISFLDTGEVGAHWANTSSNALVSKLIREGDQGIKMQFEELLQGGTITVAIDEQIVYSSLDGNEEAIWSLLVASGYMKVLSREQDPDILAERDPEYELALTNLEVRAMFRRMVSGWFRASGSNYNGFIKAMLADDLKAMNAYMNRVAEDIFSSFDTGKKPSKNQPERFYHGFVLGLMVDLKGRYIITSNRESGFGRYDVMLEPRDPAKDSGIILEFKVHDPEDEKSLEETVASAKAQILEKQYAAQLEAKGIPGEKIRSYGFAFEGKRVLIG